MLRSVRATPIQAIKEVDLPKYAKQIETEEGKAKVISAVELSERIKKELRKKIFELVGRPVKVEFEVDSSLVAGIVIRTSNTLIDFSVKSKISELSKKIKEEIEGLCGP